MQPGRDCSSRRASPPWLKTRKCIPISFKKMQLLSTCSIRLQFRKHWMLRTRRIVFQACRPCHRTIEPIRNHHIYHRQWSSQQHLRTSRTPNQITSLKINWHRMVDQFQRHHHAGCKVSRSMAVRRHSSDPSSSRVLRVSNPGPTNKQWCSWVMTLHWLHKHLQREVNWSVKTTHSKPFKLKSYRSRVTRISRVTNTLNRKIKTNSRVKEERRKSSTRPRKRSSYRSLSAEMVSYHSIMKTNLLVPRMKPKLVALIS
jgi:hypothetical protein